jgi:DNA-binding transcriptional ArsR family regulator
MAAVIAYRRARRGNRQNIRRCRVFRDRTHPLEVFDDQKVYRKFRFHRQAIFELTDEVSDVLEYPAQRKGSLPPLLQVLVALRFYAIGTFQNAVGDLIGVDQSTVSRTLTRVTDAFLALSRRYIKMPTKRQATASKVKFYNMQRFPNVHQRILQYCHSSLF